MHREALLGAERVGKVRRGQLTLPQIKVTLPRFKLLLLKQMFRWGVENELVSGEVFHAIQIVSGLRRGRSGIPERHPVRPVPQYLVDALEPYVSREVWAMICLQRLTAATSARC